MGKKDRRPKSHGRLGFEYNSRKVHSTGERVGDETHREEDQPVTDQFGDPWTKKHTGYGTKETLQEEWKKTEGFSINPSGYNKIAGSKDPGAPQKGVRGAYGFARMGPGSFTTGKKYMTIADTDNPTYEYERAGAAREDANSSAPNPRFSQQEDDGRGSRFNDPDIEDAEVVDNEPAWQGSSAPGGGRRSSAPGGPDEQTYEGEIVDDDPTGQTRRARHDDTIDAEGWDVDNGAPLGAAAGRAGLPFRRNSAAGIGSAMMSRGALGSGPLALPFVRPAGPAAAGRTAEGALPMSAGSMADIATDPVPGFNTGQPTSGPRRGAARPKLAPGDALGPMWTKPGSMAGSMKQNEAGFSVQEYREQGMNRIGAPSTGITKRPQQ